VFHAVSNFLTAEDVRTCKVREFGEKPIVARPSDDRFDGYGFGIGCVPSCGEAGGSIDEALVSWVHRQPIVA
jgi:hypothetical protein